MVHNQAQLYFKNYLNEKLKLIAYIKKIIMNYTDECFSINCYQDQ